MDITPKALERIRELRSLKRLPPGAGVRLAFRDGTVVLRWDPAGPRANDMVVKRQPPIFVETRAYIRLADYELDLVERADAAVFLLRHKLPVPATDRRRKA